MFYNKIVMLDFLCIKRRKCVMVSNKTKKHVCFEIEIPSMSEYKVEVRKKTLLSEQLS
jgi:hypothetical protein